MEECYPFEKVGSTEENIAIKIYIKLTVMLCSKA